MATKTIIHGGESFANIQTVRLPVAGGGNADFVETSDANASATDIASGKTAYVNGEIVTGTHTCSGGTGGTSGVVKTTGSVISSDTTTLVGGIRTLEIPMDGTLYDNYIVCIKAINTYAKIDNEWTEKTGLDFSACSETKYPFIAGMGIYPSIATGDITNTAGTYTACTLNGSVVRGATTVNTSAEEASTMIYTVSAEKIVLKSSRQFVSDEYKIKYEYTVIAWDN